MQTKPRIYIPKSKAKTQKTSFGDVMKLGFHSGELIKFVQANTNDAGYINIDIVPRREVDQYGNTHSVVLNDWKPNAGGSGAQKSDAPKLPTPEDDVPFN